MSNTVFNNVGSYTISNTNHIISSMDPDEFIIKERLIKELISEKEYNKLYSKIKKDIEAERKKIKVKGPLINNVDFQPPMTVVCWDDGTKTFVRTTKDDEFDPEKGIAMAIAKKYLGSLSERSYNKIISYYVDKFNRKNKK